ncbi:MAG TPA: response regulator [Polyangiaceae bacterium]|nr:response regulator [Polyangiaceae bacterium]
MAYTASKVNRDEAEATAGRVLLVDDQPELRRLMRRGLIKAGYVVVEAWNGQVAVELAQQLRFDVVISDVHMPDMSGVELLEALQELDPDLPVVLTSGSSGGAVALQTARLSAFAYLEKPVPLETIRSTAHSAVELRRARGAARDRFEPHASVERLRIPPPPDDDVG